MRSGVILAKIDFFHNKFKSGFLFSDNAEDKDDIKCYIL